MGDDDGGFADAKLREFVTGQIKENDDLYRHAGIVEPGSSTEDLLSFIESITPEIREQHPHLPPDLGDTRVGQVLRRRSATTHVGRSVHDVPSFAVGITDHQLEGDELLLVAQLIGELENNGAPAFVTGAGNPNTGKTNNMSMLAEIRSHTMDDEYMVISNAPTWEFNDVVVTSCHDLAVTLLEHRQVPKFVMIDESSTHFDARTYRMEVAQQWTPLAKRMAKVGVDVCGNVIHSGKDLHPEAKRLTTLAFWKEQPDEVEYFGRWPADDDRPADPLFGGTVTNLEPTSQEYDPDDSAPWKWDLRNGLFQENYTWDELLVALKEAGPADDA